MVRDALNYYHRKSLYLFDSIYTFAEIEKTCRDLGPLDVVFVDYIQNLQGKGPIYERMARLPVQFEQMAKAHNTCIVCMSQVSNEAVKGGSDEVIGYKGAGELAASCDLGLWLRRDKHKDELMYCYVRKNRHGPKCMVELEYRDRFTRIAEKH